MTAPPFILSPISLTEFPGASCLRSLVLVWMLALLLTRVFLCCFIIGFFLDLGLGSIVTMQYCNAPISSDGHSGYAYAMILTPAPLPPPALRTTDRAHALSISLGYRTYLNGYERT